MREATRPRHAAAALRQREARLPWLPAPGTRGDDPEEPSARGRARLLSSHRLGASVHPERAPAVRGQGRGKRGAVRQPGEDLGEDLMGKTKIEWADYTFNC